MTYFKNVKAHLLIFLIFWDKMSVYIIIIKISNLNTLTRLSIIYPSRKLKHLDLKKVFVLLTAKGTAQFFLMPQRVKLLCAFLVYTYRETVQQFPPILHQSLFPIRLYLT